MARVTKEKLIGDVELRLTQAAPSQDLEIEHRQIAFWLTNARNALVAQEIEQELKKGNQVPPWYSVRDTCKQMTEEEVDCIDPGEDGKNARYWFELSQPVIDVRDDNGIVQVLTNEMDEVYKSNLSLIPMFANMRYTKPSSQIISWSREGELIYIKGFKVSDIDLNEIIVSYVPKIDLEELADEDEVAITDVLLPILIDLAAEIGKKELYGSQGDTTNDAVQDQKPVYHTQIQQPQPQPQE